MARRSSGARRILILTASLGGSHRAAGEALQRYLRSAHARTVEVEIIDFLDTFLPKSAVLARLAYQRPERFFPSGLGTLDQVAERFDGSPVVSELRDEGLERLAHHLRAARPDAVVSTLPLAAGTVAEARGDRGPSSSLVLTDYTTADAWLHPATDLTFVACRETRDDLVVARLPYDRVVVSGIPVHERFAEALVRSESRTTLGLSERFTALVVAPSGGAADVRTLVAGLLRAGTQVVVLMGTDDRARRGVSALAAKGEQLVVSDGSEGVHRLISAADIVLCGAGGATSAECVVSGTPFIILAPIPGQESGNVDFLVNSGVTLVARDEADAIGKVHFLAAHPERLKQLASNATVLRRTTAAQTICERVLAAL